MSDENIPDVDQIGNETAVAEEELQAAVEEVETDYGDLEGLRSGKRIRPRRTLIYGVEGIGKTTFGTRAPKPIVICTDEDGVDDIDCESVIKRSYNDLLKTIAWLIQAPHGFETAVFDTLNGIEKLIYDMYCEQHSLKSIDQIDYSKGKKLCMPMWRVIREGLTELREKRNMGIILVAHAGIEKFKDPENESYDRWVPAIYHMPGEMWRRWCDEVFFASFETVIKSTDEGFNQTRSQGIGQGTRILRTSARPAFVAKNRLYGMEHEIDLSYAAYAEHLPQKGQ